LYPNPAYLIAAWISKAYHHQRLSLHYEVVVVANNVLPLISNIKPFSFDCRDARRLYRMTYECHDPATVYLSHQPVDTSKPLKEITPAGFAFQPQEVEREKLVPVHQVLDGSNTRNISDCIIHISSVNVNIVEDQDSITSANLSKTLLNSSSDESTGWEILRSHELQPESYMLVHAQRVSTPSALD
jgi:hypothetical protein